MRVVKKLLEKLLPAVELCWLLFSFPVDVEMLFMVCLGPGLGPPPGRVVKA